MCVQDPYLELTGPTRGVVVVDPTEFEVKLKVKGSTESEDRDLSFLITRYNCYDSENRSRVINRVMTSLLSTLELTFGHIVRSVEATISVRFIHRWDMARWFPRCIYRKYRQHTSHEGHVACLSRW